MVFTPFILHVLLLATLGSSSRPRAEKDKIAVAVGPKHMEHAAPALEPRNTTRPGPIPVPDMHDLALIGGAVQVVGNSRATANVETVGASAIPSRLRGHVFQLAGWKRGPNEQCEQIGGVCPRPCEDIDGVCKRNVPYSEAGYTLEIKNNGGTKVRASVTLTPSFNYGGCELVGGVCKGKYLKNCMVFASGISTAWNWGLNVEAKPQQPINVGTHENPVAEVTVAVDIMVNTYFSTEGHHMNLIFKGDGTITCQGGLCTH